MESVELEPNQHLHVVAVARQDRWQVRQRLLELAIPAICSPDGKLLVEVNSGVEVLQVRSVVRQFQARRDDLIYWLEDCWRCPSPDCAA